MALEDGRTRRFAHRSAEMLEICLQVLAQMHEVDEDHPDFVEVRRATAKMFKAVKRQRRLEIRAAVSDADRAVVAATATGSPDRIDDETAGLPLALRPSAGASAGS